MKKKLLLLLLAIFAIGGGRLWAQYTWQGGSAIDATAWNTPANWGLEHFANGDANGPGVPSSNMWNVINIEGATGTTPTMEGWELRMSLTNSTIVSDVNKLQNSSNATCFFALNGSSSLQINFSQGHNYPFDVNFSGSNNVFTFNLSKSYSGGQGSGVASANYGTISSDNSNVFNVTGGSYTLPGLTINATLPNVLSAETTFNKVKVANIASTITVPDLTYNITAAGYTLSDVELTEENKESNKAKYYYNKDAEGNVYISWVTGNVNTHTIKYVLDGVDESKWVQTVEIAEGANYPAISVALPFGVVATVPSGSVTTDETKTLGWSFSPFNYSTSVGAISSWYALHNNGNALIYFDNSDNKLKRNTSIDDGYYAKGHAPSDAYKWAFVGNPFDGFKIYNKGAQKYISQQDNSTDYYWVTLGDDGSVFKMGSNAHNYSGSGYYFKVDGYSNYLNQRGDHMSGWSGNDGGSSFKAFAVIYDPITDLAGNKALKAPASNGTIKFLATSATEALATGATACKMHAVDSQDKVVLTYDENRGAYTIADKYGNLLINNSNNVDVVAAADATNANKYWFITAASNFINNAAADKYTVVPFTTDLKVANKGDIKSWNMSGNFNSNGANTQLGTWNANGGNSYAYIIDFEDTEYIFNKLKNAAKFDILEGSTVQGPSEFANPVTLNAAIDAAQDVADNDEARLEFINSTNGQMIQKYLDETARYGALANIQFTMGAEWGTLILPCPSSKVSGLKTYTCASTEDDVLNMSEHTGNISYNTPYIIQAQVGSKYTIIGWDKGGRSTYTIGCLTGVLAEDGVYAPAESYILSKYQGELGFYQVEEDNVKKIPQNKCYLQASAGGNVKAFYFDEAGIETSVKDVFGKSEISSIYNLSGQKMNKLHKGINIVNGKKILVK